MKRSLRTAAGCLLISGLLLAGCSGRQEQSMADYIGIDAAQAAALEAAGVTEEQADFSVSGLDSHDGTFYYEVRFTAGGDEYRYAVDALTGVIIEEAISPAEGSEAQTEAAQPETAAESLKAAQETQPETADSIAMSQADTTGRGYIGVSGTNRPQWGGSLNEEEAKLIALEDAGVTEDDIAFIRIERDWDDGIATYDVEFMTSDYAEYDYTIDATSGEILGMDQDMEHYYQAAGQGGSQGAGNGAGHGASQGQSGQSAGGELISEDAARAIVLERVPGAAAQDIWLKLERDDGRLEYEGELFHEGMEYEFKIDAYSGSVTEWESERR